MKALAVIADEVIDASDLAELPPGAWKDVVRGKFCCPVKQADGVIPSGAAFQA